MEQLSSNSITTIVRRRVRAGKEADYEAWLAELLREASRLPGYLGTDVQKPAAPDRTYVSIFRFDTLANLEAFERSELRQKHLAKVAPFVEADAIWDKLTGLEVWFDAPKGTIAPQPVRWKMALLLIGLVFVLVEFLSTIVGFAAPDLNPRLALLAIVTAQVCLLTYVIMPRVTRWLAFWLFPNTDTQKGLTP
jgi:uncharacterized protein